MPDRDVPVWENKRIGRAGEVLAPFYSALPAKDIPTLHVQAFPPWPSPVNSRQQAHFNIGFNTGLNEEPMKSLISAPAAKGRKEFDNASDVPARV